ncbi:methyl-accepting chemotaxis protein [Photobacterium sanctipauli]|uniref:Methyl-accepting chemotaxis protein n=1 Tax=Photobacterium sanctipauli TaxID=1342794 RepID=A0A2T3P0X5_9GAMM|nr:methyl-accepting chemotaxis protein [Photobacterium sanctipauli]PSW22157.1 methyl-accepting chemotaxis protein [Photobacterium sanctipauli]
MNSIKQKSMLFLSGVSLLVMVVIFSGSYFTAKQYFEGELTKQMKDSDQTLSIVLKEPIFAYDTTLTKNILGSFVEFPYIYGVNAFDHRGKTIGAAQDKGPKPDEANLQTNSVDIIWDDGQKIGHIEISYRLDANEELLATTRTMFVLIGIVLLLALQITNWVVISKLVINPIQVVAKAMSEIAQGGGDLTSRLNIKTNDEVGMLAKGFDTFILNLHQLVSRIVTSAEELGKCAEQIKASASNNASATQQQLSEIEQVATALNEMASATQEVSNNATVTADKTASCNDLALRGNTSVQKTVDEIHNLGDEVTTTSSTIAELKEKSEHINTVLEVIKGIAEQTNLLALNAAIEAARAGEQGRGFAVVADEVRALAQRTQNSTEEIEGIINDLQASSTEASQQMNTTRSTLAQTLEESGQAIQALEEIITDIRQINDMNTQVATATEEQNAVAGEVSEKVVAINSITTSVTSNAAHVGELSSRLEEISAGIKADLSKFRL